MSGNLGRLQDTVSQKISVSDTLNSNLTSRKDTIKKDTVKNTYVSSDTVSKQQPVVLTNPQNRIVKDSNTVNYSTVAKPVTENLRTRQKKTIRVTDQDSLQITPEAVHSKNFLQLLSKSDSEKLSRKGPVFVNSSNNNLVEHNPSTGLFNRNIIKQPTDFILGILLIVIILIVWIRQAFRKFITGIISALLSYQISFKMFQQRNMVMKRAFFMLNIIYVIVLSLFIFEVLRFYKLQILEFTGLIPFLVLIGIIVSLLLARLIVLKLTGFIFDRGNIFAEYIHNVFLVNKNLGLFLIPIVIGVAYLPHQMAKIAVILGIALIISAYLYRLVRGFQIIFRKDVFIFYLILYLCTLEILPLLIGYKFLYTLS